MGNTTALVERQFGSADIEMAIHLQGVAINDLTAESFGDGQGQFAFSAPGGANDGNQRQISRICSTRGYVFSNGHVHRFE